MSDTPETAMRKTERTPAQLEALARARVRANEVRAQNAETRRREKAIRLAEKALKVTEVDKRYQEIQQSTKPQIETAPEPEVVEAP